MEQNLESTRAGLIVSEPPASWSEIKKRNVVAALDEQGLVWVRGYVTTASQWCTGSASFPEADPPHDSWGDCTECGEELIWVVTKEVANVL